MGAPSARNVAAAKPKVGGGVYKLPLGSPLPTDATTALDASAVALGYVSEDGIQPSNETSVEQIKAWGGDIVAALATDSTREFEFTLIGLFDADVQKFINGDENVTVAGDGSTTPETIAVQDKAQKIDNCILVFEMFHGDKTRRVVVPYADSVVSGEEPWVDGSLTAYTVTTTALKDDSGVRVYDYMEKSLNA